MHVHAHTRGHSHKNAHLVDARHYFGCDGLEHVLRGILLIFEGMGEGFESKGILLEGVDEGVELLDASGFDSVPDDEIADSEVVPMIAGTTIVLVLLG